MKSAENATLNVDQKLKEAASQTKRRNQLLSKLHEDILPSDWSYVRALALPLVPSYKAWKENKKDKNQNNNKKNQPELQVCDNCRSYILDRNRLELVPQWLEAVKDQQGGEQLLDRGWAEQQYGRLLTRIIGFLLVSDCEPQFNNLPFEERMVEARGQNEEAVVGGRRGVTSEQPSSTHDVAMFSEGSVEEKKGAHLGSLRTVFLWNKAQVSVLQDVKTRRLILDADFGCGKTLMLKSRPLHLANTLEDHQQGYFGPNKMDIVFLSVSSARTQVSQS